MILAPSGVYFTALFRRFTSTCTISPASILASSISSGRSVVICLWAASRSMCRRASSTGSATNSVCGFSFMVPFSVRVMVSRFSTRPFSQMASSWMEV